MSHAWLFTGPPGLRPVQRRHRVRGGAAVRAPRPAAASATRATPCWPARTPTSTVIRTEKLSIGVDEVRDLVRALGARPVGRRWQIMIVEDADRLTEQACNALLKAIEEPTDRTVWMLCAPTVEDVLPTIRSRCRLVTLSTPTTDDVAAFLVRTRRRRRRRSRRTPPAPARATSAGPGRWPATRRPATVAARWSRSPPG